MDRRDLVAGLLAGGVALSAGRTAVAAERDGAALAEAFAATLTARNMTAFADLYAEDYVQDQPVPAGVTAKQAIVRYFGERVTAFPDLKVTAGPVVAAGEWVAANFIYTGTHRGDYFGVPPSGRSVTFNSTAILRIRDGRFAAHWGAADIAGLLRQLKGA